MNSLILFLNICNFSSNLSQLIIYLVHSISSDALPVSDLLLSLVFNLCIFKISLYDNFLSNFLFIKYVNLLVLLQSVFKLEFIFVLVNIILFSILFILYILKCISYCIFINTIIIFYLTITNFLLNILFSFVKFKIILV